jgi:hypothetical protein
MKEGFQAEVHPLFGNRARIVITDGTYVEEFW